MKTWVVHNLKPGNVIRFLLLFCCAVVFCFPLFRMLSLSFMGAQDLYASSPRIIPSRISLDAYRTVLSGSVPIFTYLKNTVIMAIGITIVQLFLSSISAFALVVLDTPFKKGILIFILSSMMIPFEATMVSNYLLVSGLNLRNTYLGLMLPFFASPAGVFLMRQQFLSMPQAIYDAASIDGCRPFRLFFQVLLPLSKGALASLGVFSMVSAWNQYVWPLIVTDKNEMRTVQVGISMLQGLDFSDYSVVMAGMVLLLIPCLLIFIGGHKFFVTELMAGAIKG